jgi:5-methylcytosine-specific restriction protein A
MPQLKLKQASTQSKVKQQSNSIDSKAERQAIYNTRRWQRLRKEILMKHPICQLCNEKLAEHVHHIDSFMNYENDTRIIVAFNSENLQALCAECHTKIHTKIHVKNQK